jgi:hypothetical protein
MLGIIYAVDGHFAKEIKKLQTQASFLDARKKDKKEKTEQLERHKKIAQSKNLASLMDTSEMTSLIEFAGKYGVQVTNPKLHEEKNGISATFEGKFRDLLVMIADLESEYLSIRIESIKFVSTGQKVRAFVFFVVYENERDRQKRLARMNKKK